MSIELNNLLTNEQKRAVLEQSIQQFVVESYRIELNKKLAEIREDAETVAIAEKDLETLSKAVEVYSAELNSIPETAVAE